MYAQMSREVKEVRLYQADFIVGMRRSLEVITFNYTLHLFAKNGKEARRKATKWMMRNYVRRMVDGWLVKLTHCRELEHFIG